METDSQNFIRHTGFWSALTTSISSILVSVPLGFFFFTGKFTYTRFPQPTEIIIPLTGNFLLSFSFLIMTVSIHQATKPEKKIFSHIAILLATMFATLESLVSYTQLTCVIPHRISGQESLVSTFFFQPGSFLFSVEFYACSLLSAACLWLVFSFENTPPNRWIRRLFLITGILGIPIALSINFPWLWFNIVPLWSISLPAGAILVARWFKNK